jgi:hypothetical protein
MKRGRMSTQTKSQPIVFLLDLDGTLQGNISPQLQEYELIKTLNKQIVGFPKLKYNIKSIAIDYDNGLLRPHLASSLESIKEKYHNVEFFIYTASSDEWAKFIVPMVIKKVPSINPLFFSRRYCSPDGKKSIQRVSPFIKEFLSSKYDVRQLVNVFLVDNNLVLRSNELDKLIHCPTYEYEQTLDVTRNIPYHVRSEHFRFLSDEIFKGQSSTDNEFEFMMYYYGYLMEIFKRNEVKNKNELRDRYWKDFARILNSFDRLTSKTIPIALRKLRLINKSHVMI